jgi:hypothetical protein
MNAAVISGNTTDASRRIVVRTLFDVGAVYIRTVLLYSLNRPAPVLAQLKANM